MTNETPIDELFFWKTLIEDTLESDESVPDMMFELLVNAEKKTMYYLIDKYKSEETLH